MNLIITGAELEGVADMCVAIQGGTITAVGSAVARPPHADVIDAAGGAVIPGLHDHHLHLRALAALRNSVGVGPDVVANEGELAIRLRAEAAGRRPGEWIRAVGYHESVAGSLDRHRLDALVADRPLRVQHTTGILWMLNTAAARETRLRDCAEPGVERDANGVPNGRLWRMDRWLSTATPPLDLDFAALGRQATACGVTGFTDADPDRTADDLRQLEAVIARRDIPQRVLAMAPPSLKLPDHPRLSVGPMKIVLDDDRLPLPDVLAAAIAAAHVERRPVAIHCVTRAQLVIALVACADAGVIAGDRIEHASVAPPELIDQVRSLGVTVVTQPNFVSERGDRYLEEVDEGDRPHLYPCRSLLAARVPLAAGSDAPHGDPDPWRAIAAATTRRTRKGRALGADERISAETALSLFLGHAEAPASRRRVAVGQPADLCILRRPLPEALAAPSSKHVAVTVIDGQIAWDGR